MTIIQKIYYWLHARFSKPDERGEYSAGYWQDVIRGKVFELCDIKSGKLLEVGCGEGLFLAKFASSELKKLALFGIDIWEDILLKANQRFAYAGIKNVNLSQADAQELPFENEFFDRVVCVNVFFNLPTEDAVRESMREMSRVLKADGKVFFDIRNSRNFLLFVKYKLAKYYDETVKNLPLRMYKLSKIAAYTRDAGLEIVRIIPIGFPQNDYAPLFIIEARKIR